MKPNSVKRCGRYSAIALVLLMTIQTGCTLSDTFLTVAGPALQSGTTEIVNGLLDGFFAVIDPQANTQ